MEWLWFLGQTAAIWRSVVPYVFMCQRHRAADGNGNGNGAVPLNTHCNIASEILCLGFTVFLRTRSVA